MVPDSEHQKGNKAGAHLLGVNRVVGKETDAVQTITWAGQQPPRTWPLPVCEVWCKVAYPPRYPLLENLYCPPKPNSHITPNNYQECCFSGGVWQPDEHWTPAQVSLRQKTAHASPPGGSPWGQCQSSPLPPAYAWAPVFNWVYPEQMLSSTFPQLCLVPGSCAQQEYELLTS